LIRGRLEFGPWDFNAIVPVTNQIDVRSFCCMCLVRSTSDGLALLLRFLLSLLVLVVMYFEYLMGKGWSSQSVELLAIILDFYLV
jgi:hypothetical protein